MILVINTLIENRLPWWAYPFIIIYLIGAAIAIKGVNKRKKWWQKVLFVIFWPFFFAAIMIALINGLS